jgi:hypothetical protein
MKISLIDFDNTGFPNLPLMKISAYHKERGDEVKFYEPLFDKPDIIYGSKVFSQTGFSIPNEKCQVNLGGTGFDYGKYFCLIKEFVLRPEIEHICPDYELYKKNYSMGFITRGCIRNCNFCIVPRKEGYIRFNAHINEFQKHKKVIFLDNNILACNEGINELSAISKTDTKIDINQGLDFRLVDEHIAELLAKIKWIRFIRTACDNDNIFNDVKKAVELLEKKGVKPYRIFCYCLVKSKKDALRISELAKLGIDVFAMGYMDFETGYKSKEVIDVCNWCNLKKIFAQCKNYEEYRNQKKRRR